MIRPFASLPFRMTRALLAGLLLFGGSCLVFVAGGQAAPSMQGVEIHTQSFEDPTFPPAGWGAEDLMAGSGQPPNHTWGRETCETAPGGGNATAWALRGGTAGQQLGCLAPYSGIVSSVLYYGPIDTRPYPDGLEVNFLFKINAPAAQSFRVCAEGVDSSYGCFGTGLAETDWATFPEPGVVFESAGNKEQVWIEFSYSGISENPPIHFGALIDEVVIRGRGGSPSTPTTGPTSTTTPTATAGPTSTASPTATAIATATTEPTRPPTLTPRPSNTPPPPATATATRTQTALPSATPQPTVTVTIEPGATSTGVPTATSSPEPASPTPPIAGATPSPSPTQPAASATPDGPRPGTATPEATPSPPPTDVTPSATATDGPTDEPSIYLPFCVVQRG